MCSEHDVTYLLSTTPNSWLVSRREFVNLRRKKMISADEYVCVERCTEHASAPNRENESIIRAKTVESAVSIKKCKDDPNCIEIVAISSLNLGGWVPDFLLMQSMKSSPDQQWSEMETAYNEYVKEHNKK